MILDFFGILWYVAAAYAVILVIAAVGGMVEWTRTRKKRVRLIRADPRDLPSRSELRLRRVDHVRRDEGPDWAGAPDARRHGQGMRRALTLGGTILKTVGAVIVIVVVYGLFLGGVFFEGCGAAWPW